MTAAMVVSEPVPAVVGTRCDRKCDLEDECAKVLDGTGRAADTGHDAFRTVHRGAAADSDKGFAAVVFVQLQSSFDVLDARVRLDLIIDDILDAFLLHGFEQAIEKVEAHETLIGDDEDLFLAVSLDLCGQLLDCSGAINDLRIREEPAPEVLSAGKYDFDAAPHGFFGFPFVVSTHSNFLPQYLIWKLI